jgi:hypothetical protein
MHLLNKKNNSYVIAATATLFALATIIAASTMAPARAATATTTSNTTMTTAATSTSSSSGIELSAQPVWQERATTVSMSPINQTDMNAIFSGNGTLTLPNSTETINFTTNGSGVISLTTQSAQAKETIITEDGETATATLYEIVKFNPATGEGKGIVIAVINTNSTGNLAPLNGMIVAGIDNMAPNGDSNVKFWEWESGISNSGVASTPMQELPSPSSATTP